MNRTIEDAIEKARADLIKLHTDYQARVAAGDMSAVADTARDTIDR